MKLEFVVNVGYYLNQKSLGIIPVHIAMNPLTGHQ